MCSMGEYYADYDGETKLFCVFHTETCTAYASFTTMEEAEADAWRRNHPNG